MAATTNVAVTSSAWALLFTATTPNVTVGLEVAAQGNLLVHVGSDPGAGDASRTGRLSVPGYHRDGVTNRLNLTLDNGNTVYGRLDRESGRVTVIG